METTNRFVIIGAGQAASQLAFSLRKEGWQGDITIIGAQTNSLYQKPFLSKSYLTGEKTSDAIRIKPLSAYHKKAINLVEHGQVSKINLQKQQVELSNKLTLDYDKLAICTGATVRQLSIPGSDKHAIFYLNTLNDANRLKHYIKQHRPRTAVVVGGGFIGLESASSLHKLGLEVTVLEHEERILKRVCSARTAGYLAQLHQANGVKILTNSQAMEFAGEETVDTVITGSGDKIACDLVLVGIGVKPNTQLAAAAGLTVDNGIVTDQHGLTNDSCIYAAGDCASRFTAELGQYTRVESVQNAIASAKQIAAHACQQPAPKAELPWFWSDQFDSKLQIAGLAYNYTHQVERIQNAQPSTWYFLDDKLVAAECINQPSAFMFAKKAISKGLRLHQEALASSDKALPECIVQEPEITPW